jgi:hypothetical protein
MRSPKISVAEARCSRTLPRPACCKSVELTLQAQLCLQRVLQNHNAPLRLQSPQCFCPCRECQRTAHTRRLLLGKAEVRPAGVLPIGVTHTAARFAIVHQASAEVSHQNDCQAARLQWFKRFAPRVETGGDYDGRSHRGQALSRVP